MPKSNVFRLKSHKPDLQPLFECPVCKSIVSGDDLINSFRLVEEGFKRFMRVIILCRTCRDTGL